MKKLLGLFLLIAFTLSSFAQKADKAVDITMDYGITTNYVTFGATDVIGVSGDSIWTYTIEKKCKGATIPKFGIKLLRVAVGGTVAVVFQQKALPTESYSTITTVTWKKTTADTTIYFIPTSSTRAVYNRISVTGSSSTAKGEIEYLDTKIFE